MNTTTTRKVTDRETAVLRRITSEAFSDESWHGPSLRTALGDVSDAMAFWRPGAGRHNIAEIAMHHAFTIWSVRKQLAGSEGSVEPFVLDGESWFVLDDARPMKWPAIVDALEAQQERLESSLAQPRDGADEGGGTSTLDLALGLTCHAVYHAGQIQLIKRLCENQAG
jgi:hypothetical protein